MQHEPYVAWRIVREFPEYEINRHGEVRNIKSGRVRKPSYNRAEYHTFTKNGKNYSRAVRPLLRKAFPELGV